MASNYLYKREFVKSQKEKGLCIQCSNPTLKGTRCEKCRNRRAEIRKENYNNGNKQDYAANAVELPSQIKIIVKIII